ncbi:hypothetical protein HMPREF0322_00686 [Desulfitobacterium hafniense DP7]|uniref:Uncharacterized protein n=1 Tax=Desulfitobacterium hafniense DP7 TaxID=537010 RepID=G9XIB1_DESHA|nr:hypothetical protein HMPREF0322_00686 [Desulfitobacterium hafniense DP7]
MIFLPSFFVSFQCITVGYSASKLYTGSGESCPGVCPLTQ